MPIAHPISQSIKQERIDLRTTTKIKNALIFAAELTGYASMSAFMVEAAYEKAKTIIKDHEVITLSDSERDQFLTLLERPVSPNTKLKQAMKKYLTREK